MNPSPSTTENAQVHVQLLLCSSVSGFALDFNLGYAKASREKKARKQGVLRSVHQVCWRTLLQWGQTMIVSI